MRQRLRAILICIAMVFGAIVSAVPAHATSSYDDNYRTTSTISVGNDQGCALQDVSTSYEKYLTNSAYWEGRDLSALKSSWQNRQRWGISQYQVYNAWGTGIRETGVWIYWTTDTSLALDWTTPYFDDVRAVSSTNLSYAMVGCANNPYDGMNSSTDITITGYNANLGSGSSIVVSNNITPGTSWGNVYKNFFVYTDYPNYPAGYAGASITSTPPHPSYVAMGDSFSSGEGNPPFEDGTDNSSDTCHRSSQAYPHLLNNDSSLNLGSMAFVACSGAGTVDVVNGKNGESSQLNAISADTTLITVTAGGDDVGFPDYATGCLNPSPCGPGTTAYDTMIDRVSSPQLVVRLETMYDAILAQATNPDAQVYVVDYPYLAPQGASSCGGFDMSGAHSIQNVLNAAIAQAVADIHNSKLHYVSTNASGSPFEGRDMCSGAPDFNGFDPVHWGYSLHPNIYGQVDYAAVVKAAILANS